MGQFSWRDRVCFVTGASGLVGSWLTKRLLGLGADIVCLVRDWVPQSELVRSGMLDRVKVVRGDVSDVSLVQRIMAEYEVEVIFHLAAQTIVGTAIRDPLGTFKSNIAGTWAVLEAARRTSTVRGVIVASSDKAYGEQPRLPYSEEMPLLGRGPYDVSKACADLLAQAYAAFYGVPVAITRCGNFFGGGDLNWNRLVPGTIRSLIRGERPILRSDGTFIRDYFYVEDGVDAYLRLAEALVADPRWTGHAFNFSYGIPLSAVEMVQRIAAVMGMAAEPVILGQASNEIRAQYLDATKARNLLGWTPEIGMDQGLRRTVEWYRGFFRQGIRING